MRSTCPRARPPSLTVLEAGAELRSADCTLITSGKQNWGTVCLMVYLKWSPPNQVNVGFDDVVECFCTDATKT